MAVQTYTWNLVESESHSAGQAERQAESLTRQRRAVIDHLMKAAFGDPQVHHRLHARRDFSAGFNALDPSSPGFVQDEAMRNIIMVGCLYLIDTTAALLKFARENEIKILPPG